jgi:hypothetical protein
MNIAVKVDAETIAGSGEPTRTYSAFVHGYESMRVVIPARA